MRKGLKVLILSLTVAIIMVVALTGGVFAANSSPGDCIPDPNPDCPNVDCPHPECPNPDRICDGDGLKYQNGGGQSQNQYRACQD